MELPDSEREVDMSEETPEVEVPNPASMIRRPSKVEEVERDEKGRFVIEEEAAPEPVVKDEVISEEPAPEAAPKSPAPEKWTSKKAKVSSSGPAVEVVQSALIQTANRRNSESVAWLQDRLAELGHADARADLRGWFSEGTAKAVAEWQKANGKEATGIADPETVKGLAAGTSATIV